MVKVRKILRSFFIGILAILLILLGLWALRGPLLSGPLSRLVEDRLAEATGVRVEIGRLGGSWIGGIEIDDVRVVATPGFPALEEGSIRRISASWSIPGLLSGREGSIEAVEIVGVRAVLDLDRLGEREAADEGDGEGGDPGPYLPAAVVVRDVEISARTGDRRVRVTGLRIDGGSAGLRQVSARLRATEIRLDGPRGTETVEDLDLDAGLEGGVLAVSGGWSRGPGRLSLTVEIPDALEDTRRLSGAVEVRGLRPSGVLRELLARAGGSFAGADLRIVLDGVSRDRTGQAEITADLEGVVVEGRPVGHVRVAASGRLGELAVEFAARGPIGRLDVTGTAGIAGDLDLEWRIHAPGVSRGAIDLRNRRVGGRISGRGRIRVEDGRFEGMEATLEGRSLSLDEEVLGEVDLTVAFDGETIAVRSLDIRHDVGRLSLRGSVGLEPESVLDLMGTVRFGDLAAFGDLLDRDVRGRIEGDVRLTGPLRDPTGRFRLTATGVGSGDRELREVTVAATVRPGRLEVEGRAEVDDETAVDFDIEIDRVDWTEFRGSIRNLAGTVRGRRIALDAPAAFEILADGRAAVTGLRIAGDDLAIRCDEALRDPDGMLAAQLGIERLDLAALAGFLDLPFTGTLDGTLTVSGPEAGPEIAATLRLADPTYGLPGGTVLDARRIEIEAKLTPDALVLKRLTAEIRAGILTAEGVIRRPFDDPQVAASVRGEGLALDRVARLSPGLFVAGTLGLELSVQGPFADLAPRGRITLQGGRLRGLAGIPAIRDIALDATIAPDAADIRTLKARTEHARMDLAGRIALHRLEPVALDVTGRVVTGSLRGLLAELGAETPVDGSGHLTVEIEGPVAEPTITLFAEGRRLRWQGEGPCDLDLKARAGNGEIVLESLRLDTPRGRVSASGSWPATFGLRPSRLTTGSLREIRGQARCGSGDGAEGGLLLTGLEDRLPESVGIRRLSGRVGFDLRRLPGDPLTRARGRVLVRDLAIRIRGQRRGLRDLDADLTLDGGKIDVARLQGRLGHAPVSVSGSIDLGAEGTPVDLRVRGDRILIVDEPTTRLRCDLDLRVSGLREHPVVTGEVRLRDLLHTENVRYLDFQTRPTLAPLPLTTDPVLACTRLDLRVTGRRDLAISNNVIRTSLSADLRIRGTVAYPEVDGAVRCHGGKFSVPGVSLAIDEAEVRFRPEEPLRPRIAFLGHTTRRRIRIEVAATGPLDALEIDMSSDPALSREDTLALLTTGVLPSELTAEKAGEAIALAGVSILLDEISGSSSIDDGDEATWLRLVREASERTEVSTDSVPGGHETIVTASFRLLDWLHLQGERDEMGEYNIDVVFRVLGR